MSSEDPLDARSILLAILAELKKLNRNIEDLARSVWATDRPGRGKERP